MTRQSLVPRPKRARRRLDSRQTRLFDSREIRRGVKFSLSINVRIGVGDGIRRQLHRGVLHQGGTARGPHPCEMRLRPVRHPNQIREGAGGSARSAATGVQRDLGRHVVCRSPVLRNLRCRSGSASPSRPVSRWRRPRSRAAHRRCLPRRARARPTRPRVPPAPWSRGWRCRAGRVAGAPVRRREQGAEEALAGGADQDGEAELGDAVQAGQQGEIVLGLLGEAQAGVDDDAARPPRPRRARRRPACTAPAARRRPRRRTWPRRTCRGCAPAGA